MYIYVYINISNYILCLSYFMNIHTLLLHTLPCEWLDGYKVFITWRRTTQSESKRVHTKYVYSLRHSMYFLFVYTKQQIAQRFTNCTYTYYTYIIVVHYCRKKQGWSFSKHNNNIYTLGDFYSQDLVRGRLSTLTFRKILRKIIH